MSKNKIKIAKLLLIILALVVAVIFLIKIIIPAALSAFWGKDIPAINDSSLSMPVVAINQEENSFYNLNKLYDTEKHQGLIDLKNIPAGKNLPGDFLVSDTWDDNQVKILLSDNQLALQYFDDAAEKGKFQSPATADPKDMSQEVIAVNPWRQIAQLKCIQAISLAKQGRNKEALSEVMKVMVVGDAIEKSQTNLITYLVGLSMEKSALDTLEKIILNVDADTKEYAEYRNKLLNYNFSDDGSSWKFEYLVSKNGISHIASENKFYFKPNKSIKERFDFFSKMISESKNPCDFEQESSKAVSGPNPIFGWYFTENAANKILINTNDSAYQGVLVKKCEVQQKYLKLVEEWK